MNYPTLPSFRTLIDYFDHWIFEEYRLPPGALSAFRILYAAFVLLIIGVPPFRWIGDKPDIFFNPRFLNVVNLFDGFPPSPFFWGLDVAVTLLFVFLLFGFQTRWTSWLLALGLFMGFSWSYAYGKINHDTLLMALVPLVMSFSGWGSNFSLDQIRRGSHDQPNLRSSTDLATEEYWPVTLLALLLGFAMFSAGMPKLLSGWLNPTTHAVWGYTVRQHYDFFADKLLTPILMHYDQPAFWEVLDYSAVLFEVGFLLAVIRRSALRLFIVLTVIFHLANCLMLNIGFARNITLYLLFIDWRPVMRWIGHHGGFLKYFNGWCLGGASAFFLAYYLLDWPPLFRAITLLLGIDALSSEVILTALAALFFAFNFWNSTSLLRHPSPVENPPIRGK